VAWTDVEEGLPVVWRELRRLLHRAWARPLWTLGLTLAASALLLVREAQEERVYRTQVSFRVAGGEQLPAHTLREFVAGQIFDDDTLVDLMRRHGLGGTVLENKPQDALEWLREELLDVRVWHAPAAHLEIGFRHRDPKLAYEAVCDLVELLAARTGNPAVLAADREVQRLDEEAAAVREQLFAARSGLSLKELVLLRARPGERPKLIAGIDGLRAEAAGRERRLTALEGDRDAARFRAQAARHQERLRFEVLEPPRPAPLRANPGRRLVKLGMLAFLLLLPLAAMAVGAYDPAVRDAGDLKRLGLRALGHVPSFPGDHVGSLDERQKRMRYTSPR
jgi:hypothetical protein